MIQNRAELLAQDEGGKRELALDLLEAGLRAVEPRAATKRALESLIAGGVVLDGARLLAFGKAAASMVTGALETFAPSKGVVSVLDAAVFPGLEVVRASHPELGEGGLEAGRVALAMTEGATAEDTFVVLVSGGGSAMLEVPTEGVSAALLEDLASRLRLAGASIDELNTVRMALSAIKGGKLARAMAPARVINVVISDVPGMPASLVASGPTVRPAGAYARASEILARRGLTDLVPKEVLERAAASDAAGAPTEGGAFAHVTTVVAAESLTARDAMAAEAKRRGLHCIAYPRYLTGEARTSGEVFVRGASRQPVDVVVASGETTVTVTGTGKGGRNQEFVLGAGPLVGDSGAVLASMGTDGIDGASPAAGALIDAGVLRRAERRKLDGAAYLARNDSYAFFASTGGALLTGRTGTNVADLVVYVK